MVSGPIVGEQAVVVGRSRRLQDLAIHHHLVKATRKLARLGKGSAEVSRPVLKRIGARIELAGELFEPAHDFRGCERHGQAACPFGMPTMQACLLK